MHDEILDLVPAAIRGRSGSVLYSGRSAFTGQRPLYLLGLNPGGNPADHVENTIGRSVDGARARLADDWSAYANESWRGRKPGTATLQPRVLHLLASVGLNPRQVPASNVVFVRSKREADLAQEKLALLQACWPMHEAVIGRLGVRVMVCMGGTAGAWVREMLGAHEQVDAWSEQNARGWTSTAHVGRSGVQVLTLPHPSIAKWNSLGADPSPLVAAALRRS